MTISRGVSGILISVAGVLVLFTTILIIASFLGSNAPIDPIIEKSIQLRSAENQLDKAQLITTIDDLIIQAENENLRAQWENMLGCLSTNCPDEAYLDLVLVTVSEYETEIPNSALLINLIAAGKYWGNQEFLLDFSRALAIAEEQIQEQGNKKAQKTWDALIECNGACPEHNDLLFELIQEAA